MIFAFLLFGTPWFWCALLFPSLFLLYLIENEKAVGALMTVLITIGVFVAFGDKRLLPWVISHPVDLAIDIGAYVLIGIVWGFVKWFFYVLRARDKYEKMRAEFEERADAFRLTVATRAASDKYPLGRGSTARTEANEESYKAEVARLNVKPAGFDKALFQHYASNQSFELRDFPPSADKNKGRIIFWMSYWPFSGVWTLINDPITRLYRRLGALFQKISHSMFAKYKADLADDPAA
jgi:uncharacterized membrane protein (DUF485 family)